MDRRQGSIVARRALAALLLALGVAGCGGRNYVQFGSTGSPSTGVSTGSTVSVQGGTSTLGTLLAVGFLAGISYQSDRDYDRMGGYAGADPLGASPPRRAPALDPSRRVAVRDCTRPIEDWSANLKCQ